VPSPESDSTGYSDDSELFFNTPVLFSGVRRLASAAALQPVTFQQSTLRPYECAWLAVRKGEVCIRICRFARVRQRGLRSIGAPYGPYKTRAQAQNENSWRQGWRWQEPSSCSSCLGQHIQEAAVADDKDVVLWTSPQQGEGTCAALQDFRVGFRLGSLKLGVDIRRDAREVKAREASCRLRHTVALFCTARGEDFAQLLKDDDSGLLGGGSPRRPLELCGCLQSPRERARYDNSI
jgi:hypothetical protein